MQVRWILLVLVLLAVLVVLLGPRREGLSASDKKKCSQSYESGSMQFDASNANKYPPLRPKECKGVSLKRGTKCWTSDGKKWEPAKKSSDCKNSSWMGFVDWKSAHSSGRTNKSPFKISKAGWKRRSGYDASDWDDNKGISGMNGDWVTGAEDCASRCVKETNGCVGFALSKKQNSNGKYDCWGRKANTADGKLKIVKRPGPWSLYTWKDADLGVAGSKTAGSSTGATTADTTDTSGVIGDSSDGCYIDIAEFKGGDGKNVKLQCGVYGNNKANGDRPLPLGIPNPGYKSTSDYPGPSNANTSGIGWVSQMSSFKVPDGVQVKLFTPDTYNTTEKQYGTVYGQTKGRWEGPNAAWDNKVSSFHVSKV